MYVCLEQGTRNTTIRGNYFHYQQQLNAGQTSFARQKNLEIFIVYVVTREVHYFWTIKNIADIFVAIVHNRLCV